MLITNPWEKRLLIKNFTWILSDEDAFPKAGDVEVVVEFMFGRNLVLTRNPQKVEVESYNQVAVSYTFCMGCDTSYQSEF